MLGNIFLVIGIIFLFVIISFFILVSRSHKKVTQGKALVRSGFGGAHVALDSGMFVIPILHKVEEMDISTKSITINEETITADNESVNIKIQFFILINKDFHSIVQVAQTIGCVAAGKLETVEALFKNKFIDATHSASIQFDYIDLLRKREDFKMRILDTIGTDLYGYMLDDCSIIEIKKVINSDIGEVVLVLLDEEKPLNKGDKIIVSDRLKNGKTYLVRRIND